MDQMAKIVDQYTDHNVFHVPKVAYSITELAAELNSFHFCTPYCYDEPEILRCSSHAFCPIGADVGHVLVVLTGAEIDSFIYNQPHPNEAKPPT